jgi:hypothetical protein
MGKKALKLTGIFPTSLLRYLRVKGVIHERKRKAI